MYRSSPTIPNGSNERGIKMILLIKTYEFLYNNGKWVGIYPVYEEWQLWFGWNKIKGEQNVVL